MRPLFGLLVIPLVALTASAQERWNDDRTTALVREAIARRAVQLADTGLRDYTARAHGYVTFLAQLGAGFPLPPAVIKSDELMVEVYWGAPDRSKQRVVGRRDTLLLPTDIAYHRDHLGVVQNNFPAIIRLGNGDEVRDVPHPLSAEGFSTYDYRIADSLAIRAGEQAIDVLMVRVRPKDDRVPAAIGAVYIERGGASIVRMTFSFTRAALRDPQLDDVSVILENGLVDGRFWLPRRQEIEIRRSVTWMDFPVRGIIRGRWEICCVETNVSLAPRTFIGPEIVEAPRADQRRYPFEGTVLGGLPEEVRAFDAAEVRRVQEEARELVRNGALARARKSSPTVGAVSDIVRVGRAEGLAFGFGVRRALGAGLSAKVKGRYGTADHRWKGVGSLAWQSARGSGVALEFFDNFAEAGDAPEVSGLRNSIAAQEFGSDWTDPYGVAGASLRLDLAPLGPARGSVTLARERQRPLGLRALPATGAYEPLLLADPVTVSRLVLGIRVHPTSAVDALQWGGGAQLAFGRSEAAGTGETSGYLRASAEVGVRGTVGAWRLESRTLAAGVSAGVGVPTQALVYFGGPVTGPGYGFHSLSGRVGLSQRIEASRRIPFVPLNLGRFGRSASSLVVSPYLHGVVTAAGAAGSLEWRPSVGVGITGLFDLFRIDVARGLRDGNWLFSIDVAREFWLVM